MISFISSQFGLCPFTHSPCSVNALLHLCLRLMRGKYEHIDETATRTNNIKIYVLENAKVMAIIKTNTLRIQIIIAAEIYPTCRS